MSGVRPSLSTTLTQSSREGSTTDPANSAAAVVGGLTGHLRKPVVLAGRPQPAASQAAVSVTQASTTTPLTPFDRCFAAGCPQV